MWDIGVSGMQPMAHENRLLGHSVLCRAEKLLEGKVAGYVEQWVNSAVLRGSHME